jgi:hypothetical protein
MGVSRPSPGRLDRPQRSAPRSARTTRFQTRAAIRAANAGNAQPALEHRRGRTAGLANRFRRRLLQDPGPGRGYQMGLGRLRSRSDLAEQASRVRPGTDPSRPGDFGPLCRSSGLQRAGLGGGPGGCPPPPHAVCARRYRRQGWSRIVRPSLLRFAAVDDHPGPMDGIGSGDRGIPEARPTPPRTTGRSGVGGSARRSVHRRGPNGPIPPRQLGARCDHHSRRSHNGKAKGIDACPPVAIAEAPPG